jgi:hypothetical protein
MRWILAALSGLLVAGTVAAQVPGGHEAFNYWFNGTKWVETSAANPLPVGTAQGGVTVPQVGCNATATYDASTLGSTQLVALVAGQTIYICGYTIFANGVTNVELDSGTGAACAAATVKIVPAYQLQAQSGISDQSSIFRGLKTAAGSALCIKSSAAAPVQAIVYYAQF